MSTYADTIERLVSARRFGVVLGLERMQALFAALGRPDERLGRVIHVGGTNGKGSVVALLASMLRAAGLRVGAYTSPHLNRLVERVAIDGEPIETDAFARIADRVSAAGGDELTFFEQVTAIAVCAFADANLDVTLLEVGLGGRLDATNAVRADVAVITGVALDHEAILGPTLAAIAREKAGIFKPGARIVIGGGGEAAAMPVLVDVARAAGREPVVVTAPTALAVGLPGAHQRMNAAVALAALDELAAAGGPVVGGEARERGLATACHPGRFEIVEDTAIGDAPRRRIILDGAHNPHGAAALAAALRERGERPALVLGVSADKDARAIVQALVPAAGAIVATRSMHERALPAAELAALVREVSGGGRTVLAIDEPAEAVREASRYADCVVVAGSLFLVGDVRGALLGLASDPPAVTDPAARKP